jgi:hypothetical protein
MPAPQSRWPVHFRKQSRFKRAVRIAGLLMLLAGAAWGDMLSSGPFRVHYSPEAEADARAALQILERALDELGPRLPAGDAPIDVVIAHDQYTFNIHAGRLAHANVGGIARPEEGFIAVKAPGLMRNPARFESTVIHELVHVLLVRNTAPGNLPRWLNEGIAMTLAGEHRWNSSLTVGQMYLQGRLIPYRDLAWVLQEPGQEMAFGDAYAQSISMTRWLKNELGDERFWEVVQSLDSQSFGAALHQELGIYPAEMWEQWRNSLWHVALVSSIVSGFSLFQLMAILTLVAYVRRRRRGKAIMRRWAREDADENGPEYLTWADVETDGELPFLGGDDGEEHR